MLEPEGTKGHSMDTNFLELTGQGARTEFAAEYGLKPRSPDRFKEYLTSFRKCSA